MPTVLITGAGRGIGLEFAKQYLAAGWQVIALQRSASDALSALPVQQHLRVLLCSLTDDKALAETAASLSGETIDVVINNAGAMNDKGFGDFDREAWARVFDINVYTPQRVSELLVENLAASSNARLLTVSSMLGSMQLNTSGGLYAYRASKAAANAIMKAMAVDLADRGIVAAALHPGWVRTDMGGSQATLDTTTSVAGLRGVIETLTADRAGELIDFKGRTLPW